MAWWRLAPTWLLWLLAILLVGGGQQARVWWAQADAAGSRTELADYRLEISERDRRTQAKARTEEQRRQAAADERDRNAKEELDAVRSDAARTDGAFERFQLRYAELERRSRACGNAVTAKLGQAAEDEARMRADVLGRLGAAARLYAAEADERGVAGRACEAVYDRVRGGG